MKSRKWTLIVTLILCVFFLAIAHATFAQTGEVLRPVLAWNATGNWLAVTIDQRVVIYDLFQETIVTELYPDGFISALRWNPQNSLLAGINPTTGVVYVWDITNGDIVATLQGPSTTHPFALVDWNYDGSLLAAGALESDGNTKLHVWSYDRDQFQLIPVDFSATFYDLRWSPTSNTLGVATRSGIVLLENLTNGNYSFHRVSEFALNFSWRPDGLIIAATDPEDYLELIEVSNGTSIAQLTANPPFEDVIVASAWSLEGNQVDAVTFNGRILTWDVASRMLLQSATMENFELGRNAAAWSPYGGRVALAGNANMTHDTRSSVQALPFTIVVPDPSPERLNAIAAACDAPPDVVQALTALDTTTNLSAFEASVNSAAADIPPACAADLLAVAEAMAAQ